jgi:hypothetical protein
MGGGLQKEGRKMDREEGKGGGRRKERGRSKGEVRRKWGGTIRGREGGREG